MVQIQQLQENEIVILMLAGEIDAKSSIDLDLAIAKSVAEGFKKILIDCGQLDYISSAGLGVFMSYIDEMKESQTAMVLYGMSEKVASTFQILGLAMDEICSNLIIHAHQCDEYHEVEIRIEVPDKKSVVFEVIDDKAIFDINKYQAMPLNEIVHERRRGGLGVRLVKSIMDNVEYYNRNGKFVCRLTKSYH